MVMPPLPLAANSGQYLAAGSSRRRRPASTNCMTAVVVATTLVMEARSKTVSVVMGVGMGHGGPQAEALLIDHPALVAHQDDGAGSIPGGDLLVGHLGDAGKAG